MLYFPMGHILLYWGFVLRKHGQMPTFIALPHVAANTTWTMSAGFE
jgi:hypothetical protein